MNRKTATIEEYKLTMSPRCPDVRFLYITGWHLTNSWQEEQDLNTYKFNLMLLGNTHIIINNNVYVVNPGDCLLYRPHEIHHGRIPYEQEVEYFELQFEPEAFSGISYIPDALNDLINKIKFGNLFRLDPEQIKHLKSDFFRLRACLISNDKMEALSILILILFQVFHLKDPIIPTDSQEYYPAPLLSALIFIHQQFRDDISNKDIAIAASVSPSYLARIFRKHLGCSPHEYLQDFRLSKACSALLDGASVTNACFDSGFTSIPAFGAYFKKKIGVSPVNYYKKNVLSKNISSCEVAK